MLPYLCRFDSYLDGLLGVGSFSGAASNPGVFACPVRPAASLCCAASCQQHAVRASCMDGRDSPSLQSTCLLLQSIA